MSDLAYVIIGIAAGMLLVGIVEWLRQRIWIKKVNRLKAADEKIECLNATVLARGNEISWIDNDRLKVLKGADE